MKWGVRRYQKKDGTLTAAGKAHRKSAKETAKLDRNKSDKTELAFFTLKTAMDVSRMDAVSLSSDAYRLTQAGQSYVKTKLYAKEREGCKVDKKTGLLLKNKEMSREDDIARVNPAVHNFDKNTKNNCMLCTSTYDLRRRGYEVTARKALYGYEENDITSWYPKAKVNEITGLNEKGKPSKKAMIKQVKSELVKQGDGARGNLIVRWSRMKGGHSVAYEIVNGELVIMDTQVNKTYSKPEYFLKRCSPTVKYARLDNVPFDPKGIKEVAR